MTSWRSLYITTQRAHYKTGNIKKLEAAIRLYAGLTEVWDEGALAEDKLRTMVLHPFPRVRCGVVDSL